jgi:pyrroline-5-carboxylate reductase
MAFIGGGNMARSLIGALVRHGVDAARSRSPNRMRRRARRSHAISA